MSKNFFVQIVEDGRLGQLFGPASWDEAVSLVKAFIILKGPAGNETLEDAFGIAEADGAYDWGGESIHTLFVGLTSDSVQPVPIDA